MSFSIVGEQIQKFRKEAARLTQKELGEAIGAFTLGRPDNAVNTFFKASSITVVFSSQLVLAEALPFHQNICLQWYPAA